MAANSYMKQKKIMANRFREKVDSDGLKIFGKKSLGKVKSDLSDQACHNVIEALNGIARLESKGNYLQEEYNVTDL